MRVRTTTTTTTTTTESRKMAAILQLIGQQSHAALVYSVLLWYCILILGTYQNKVFTYKVSRDHIMDISSELIEVCVVLKLTNCWFSIKSRAHVRLTFCYQDRIVR